MHQQEYKKIESKERPIERKRVLKSTQEEEISGSQVEKKKELGHHRSIKRIEASQDT